MTTETVERFALPDTSVAPLFAGWSEGAYELPTVLSDAGAAYLGLVAARDADRRERDRLYPASHLTLASREAFALVDDAADRSREASDRCLRGLEGLIAGIADELVVDYLRPAHDAALAAVRDVLADLEGVDLADTASVARAGAKGTAAFLVVVTARTRLEAIEAARECVFDRQRLGTGWRDSSGGARRDGVLRDTARWPDPTIATISKAARVRVGPSHPLARVVWLADPANRAWCPTASEWEAEFDRWMADPARNGRPTGPVAVVPC